jgi:dihydropteroate synthase
MNRLGPVSVGDFNPVRIMGILNTSPESFYKKSIKTTKQQIIQTVKKIENEGADFIDVGGMSTAPYLPTFISEKLETRRLVHAVNIIQNISNLPISVDTCRANVAKELLNHGVEILNDISGLKYDKKMINVISKYNPSLVLCAYSKKRIIGDTISKTKRLLHESMALARSAGISSKKIVLDPAIGFFRKGGVGPFFTRTNSEWFYRDLAILCNLRKIKQGQPLLVSVSNKSFIKKIIDSKNPADQLAGSLASEVLSVINGADIIRTHNVKQTKEVLAGAQKLLRTNKSL